MPRRSRICWRRWPTARRMRERVMLVGHNPGLEDLVAYLARRRARDSGRRQGAADLGAGAAGSGRRLAAPEARLRDAGRADPTRAGTRRLAADRRRPGGRTNGPVPDYFFTQSAVLPIAARRQARDHAHCLAQGTRWVIPKGVKEPELSLRDSAARRRSRRRVCGATRRRADRPLRVQEVGRRLQGHRLPDGGQRERSRRRVGESHRERRWVEPKEAKRLLDEPALRKLVDRKGRRLG
jgi:phosphohistidine phosphatase